jgi:hypothetical protein
MCGISNQKNKFSIPYEKIIKVKEFLPYLERVDWQGGEVFWWIILKNYFSNSQHIKIYIRLFKPVAYYSMSNG